MGQSGAPANLTSHLPSVDELGRREYVPLPISMLILDPRPTGLSMCCYAARAVFSAAQYPACTFLLSTLRRRPYGWLRMTQGRCGSLHLQRMRLSLTPSLPVCPAHRKARQFATFSSRTALPKKNCRRHDLCICLPFSLVGKAAVRFPRFLGGEGNAIKDQSCGEGDLTGRDGIKIKFVRTFTQPLPSTVGKLVSANSNPSAESGSKCSRSIRIASPTGIAFPAIRRCSSCRQ